MMFDLEQGGHISITVGIREKLDPEIVNRLLDSIMNMKQQTKLDYLQVFEFASKSPSEFTTVTHKQEVEPFKVVFCVEKDKANYNGNVFVIDQNDCITMLLAEEY